MSDIANDFRNIRTMEEVSQALGIVLTNLNSINKNYYNIFLDSEAKYVELEMYDETGKLVTRQVPNLAMAKTSVYSGVGTPNGVQEASRGALYIDTSSGYLYYKTSDTGTQGWWQLWADQNLNYLSPNGSGEYLSNLNASSITSGVLEVPRGGTGVSSITGLLKGNGDNPFTSAVDGEDYLGSSITGMICWFPVMAKTVEGVSVDAIPHGWLYCNGAALSRTIYSSLFSVLGTTYGTGDGSTTFNIPDLRDKFIKGYNTGRSFGVMENAVVGTHTHPLSGSTQSESSHTHAPGTLKFKFTYTAASRWGRDHGGEYAAWSAGDSTRGSATGTMTQGTSSGKTASGTAHSHSLSGGTASANNSGQNIKNTVDNLAMVPIIKW